MTEDPPPRPSNRRLGLFSFLLVAVVAFLAIHQLQPPAPVPASAPSKEFSSARAMEYLKLVAQKPHPTGSPENFEVRETIVKELRELGLDPEVQTTTATGSNPKRRGPMGVATVHNVLTRLKGTANTCALMLAGHYDSAPGTPGASDDGAAVAVLLETLRALKAGRPLRNDLIFLFTDGEELGLLGARAFAEKHPWAKDVGLVLNFEARGSCGPSLMFETSPGNGWVVSEFAKAAPHPVSSSVFYEIYKRLPNSTDFSIFRSAGIAGLNFAYLGCWTRYHTARDDLEEIDARSLQHDGSYALALARHFGNLSLKRTAAGDSVYFSLFGMTLDYPQTWVVPITVLVILLFVATAAKSFRKAGLTWRGMIFGSLIWLAATIIAASFSTLAWKLMGAVHLVPLLPYGIAYGSELIAAGFIALAITIVSGFAIGFREKIGVENLTLGALLGWAILTVLTGLYLPAASYLFAWPLLFSLISLASAPARSGQRSAFVDVLALALPAISGILLVAPLVALLLNGLSTSALVPLTISVGLLVGLLIPHVNLMTDHDKWLLPAGCAMVGVGIIVAGVFRSRFDARHPGADSIFYALNADTGKAVWASLDQQPDKWTSQFLRASFEISNLNEFLPVDAPMLQAPAPATPLAAPAVSLLYDVTLGEDRLLRLWITSSRRARAVWVAVGGAQILRASINGIEIGDRSAISQSAGWGFFVATLPKEGITLTLEINASQSLLIKVADQTEALPQFPRVSFSLRPGTLMPSPLASRLDSSTLVSKSYRFAASP